jgi:hypothetical protein
MKLVSALAGLAALGAVALSGTAASAMPVAIPPASRASNVEQAAYVCNGWGHCWHRPAYGYGYYHPHYWGGWGWHRGWGDGWHHWHPHYEGGWGWHGGWGDGWHRWHHWHHWHSGWGYWHRWHQW